MMPKYKILFGNSWTIFRIDHPEYNPAAPQKGFNNYWHAYRAYLHMREMSYDKGQTWLDKEGLIIPDEEAKASVERYRESFIK